MENILSESDSDVSKVPLLGEHSVNDVKNTSVSLATIDYITLAKHFDAPLYQNRQSSICLCVAYF